MSKQRTSLRNENALIPYTKHKFNLITKILFRKQYKNNLERERIGKEIQELTNKITHIDNETKRTESQVKEKSKILSNSNPQLWEEELLLLDREKVVVDYLLRVYPELAKDSEFMKEAVQKDEKYIEYDKSNAIELYIPLLDKRIAYQETVVQAHKTMQSRNRLEGLKK